MLKPLFATIRILFAIRDYSLFATIRYSRGMTRRLVTTLSLVTAHPFCNKKTKQYERDETIRNSGKQNETKGGIKQQKITVKSLVEITRKRNMKEKINLVPRTKGKALGMRLRKCKGVPNLYKASSSKIVTTIAAPAVNQFF